MSKETAQSILEKGTELIFKNGYHSVGLQKLLDTAGIPKGSFYYYFKSKEDFGLQVIELYSRNSIEFLKSFLENKALNPKERIFDLFEAIKSVYEEQNFSQGCLLGNCSLELGAQKESFAEVITNQFESWKRVFARTIEEGQQTGSIKKEYSADDYADFLLNSWEGALVRMKSSRNVQPMDLFINFMKELL